VHKMIDRQQDTVNILHLRSSAGMFGAEKVILNLAKTSNITGVKNYIACISNSNNPQTELVKQAMQEGFEAINICADSNYGLFNKLVLVLKENKIKVIHTHGYKEDIIGLFAAKKIGIKIVSTVHGWTAHTFKVRIYEWLDKIILRFFDKIVVVSELLEIELKRAGILRSKIALIHNGIDLNEYSQVTGREEVMKEFNIDKSYRILGTIGRLSEEKGQRYFLEAFAKVAQSHNHIKCIVVGEGPERESLVNLSSRLGIREKVIFTGQRKDVRKFYSAFDIFVLPSLREGLPLVLLEALAFNKPVIASNVGSISAVINSEQTGILLKSKDVGSLASTIVDLLKSRKRTEALSCNGRKLVKENFSVTTMAENYRKVYEKLL